MTAIIEVARKGSAVRTGRQQLSAARQGRTPDFRLRFESVRSLLAELAPARLEQLGLIERNEDAAISVPYEAVEIVLPLAAQVA